MNNNIKITDLGSGLKGINFAEWGGIEGFLAATSNGASSDRNQLLRRVNPWIAKATDMTALAVSELPFDVMNESDKVVDTTSDWQNKFGGMETPSDLLYMLASSLCLGKAYVIPETTSRMVVSLQYCAPNTVLPEINTKGLQYLTRTTAQGQSGRYYPADITIDGTPSGYDGEMMYFWLPDSDVEIGPALSYPAGVAMMSAELMLGMDSSLKVLSERGFIPPTLLSVKGMPSPKDRAETEIWYNRFIRGFNNTVAKLINADTMGITKMGAGIDEVSNGYPPLIRQAIENIGTAYGIPAALFMSDAAFASEMNALIKVWYTTSVFIRIYHTIEHTFNTQLLNRYGLRMKFRPETLDAFQENEQLRSQSFSAYVSAGIKPSLAAQMVGMELPDGITYDMLDPEKVETPAQLLPFTGQPAQPEPVEDMEDDTDEEEVELDADMVKDLQAWQQIALMRHRKGKPLPVEFECKALSDALADKVRARLKSAHTEGQVFAAFNVGQDDRWLQTAQRLTAALEAANG